MMLDLFYIPFVYSFGEHYLQSIADLVMGNKVTCDLQIPASPEGPQTDTKGSSFAYFLEICGVSSITTCVVPVRKIDLVLVIYMLALF